MCTVAARSAPCRSGHFFILAQPDAGIPLYQTCCSERQRGARLGDAAGRQTQHASQGALEGTEDQMGHTYKELRTEHGRGGDSRRCGPGQNLTQREKPARPTAPASAEPDT